MVSQRYEIRLDRERRKKLDFIAELDRAPASEVVREMIDRRYEDAVERRRQLALERLLALEIPDDVPDPDELSRQLDTTHDLPDLY